MGTEEATVKIHAVDRDGLRNRAVSDDPSAEELARRAKHGCRASFAELVRRYAPRLQAFLRQKTHDHHDAEDLVQETFIRAYQNIERYRESYKFSTWLYAIGSRLAVSHHRKMQVRLRHVHPASPQSTSTETIDQREHSEDLWRLARRLPDNQYRVLWLKYAEDMSVKQIAHVMRRSQVSVKVLLYRARTNLLTKWRSEHSVETQAEAGNKNQSPVTGSGGA